MRVLCELRIAIGICLAALLMAVGNAQVANPGTSQGTEQAEKLHAYLQQAAQAMHTGDLTLAEQALRSAVALDPQSMAALNNLGIVLAREGKPAEAIPFYQRALKVRPDDTATKRNLAIAYFKAQHYRSALELLEPLAAASPNDFQLLDLAGFSLFALDRYREAASYLEKANHADPSDLETLDMLGKAYLRMKDYKILPSVFERIMKINPNSASAHVMMGMAFDDMSQREDAIKEYQAAIAADPKFMGAHSGLGYLYWRQGDSENAEKEMRAELEHFPNDPVANCILGRVLLNNSRYEEARAHFEEALKVNSKYEDALIGLGEAEVALNHPNAAISILRKAIQLNPDQAEAHFVLGTALRKSGRTEEGIREQKLSAELQNKKAASEKPVSQ